MRQNASNPTYFHSLALALQQQGRLDDALRALDTTLALKPEPHRRATSRGNLLSSLAGSPMRCQALTPRCPSSEDADAWQHRASILEDLRRFDEALASYDRVLWLRPDHAGAWLSRGNICGRLDRREEALPPLTARLALMQVRPAHGSAAPTSAARWDNSMRPLPITTTDHAQRKARRGMGRPRQRACRRQASL